MLIASVRFAPGKSRMVHLPFLSRKNPLSLVITILNGGTGILRVSVMTVANPAISPCLLSDCGCTETTSFEHRTSVDLIFLLRRNPYGAKLLSVNPPVISPCSLMSEREVKPSCPLGVGISIEMNLNDGGLAARSSPKTRATDD